MLKKMSGLIIMIICYTSCNTEFSNKVLKINLENGGYALIPYKLQNGDTIIEGKGRYFSASGMLTDEIEFRGSKKNGWHTIYENHHISIKSYYVDDTLAGPSFTYDIRGVDSILTTYSKGRKILSKSFYKNGKEHLVNFGDDGRMFYLIEYDSLGNKKNELGSSFSENWIADFSLDTIPSKEVLKIKIPIVNYPNYKSSLEVIVLDVKYKVIKAIDQLPISGDFALLNFKIDKPGLYTIGLSGELTTSAGKIIRDTLFKSIVVK